MRELLVDFITSLDGYASGEGWPSWWGLEGPEYLAWLEEQPEVIYLMGANTYRLMSGFAAGETPHGTDEFSTDSEWASHAVLHAGRSGEAYTQVPTRRSVRAAARTSVGPGEG